MARNALTGVERALFWTLAFAAFAAAAAGLSARAVDRLAGQYDASTRAYAIVRVIAPEGPVGIAAAETALAHSPLVTRAAPMTAQRAAALLGLPETDMPPLRLIEIELAAAPPGVDVSGELVAALAQGGVTAEVERAPTSASGVAERVRQAAILGAYAFALVMAIIVSLSARGLAARRRELVTVMTDLGATRSQASGRVADEAATIGLYAGFVGGVLAGIVGAVILLAVVPGATFAQLPQLLLPVDLAPLVAAPLGAALAAGAGARAAAGYFHAQAARLA